MEECVVIVPVYQADISEDEAMSFANTLRVLKKWNTVIVSHCGVDLAEYNKIAANNGCCFSVEYFEDKYFKGIGGYNSLLLSETFYKRFEQYSYMLICQLDAYVFRDELSQWCNKGYDYIGAPLVGKYTDKEFSEDFHVGNGGFSLRKVSYCLDFFKSKKNVFSLQQICKLINIKSKPHTRIFVLLMMLCGWRNKTTSVARHWKYNEDIFWSGLLDNSKMPPKKPQVKDSVAFAFERFPSRLYELNGNKLPFGCHAWRKYEYDVFWNRFIK